MLYIPAILLGVAMGMCITEIINASFALLEERKERS